MASVQDIRELASSCASRKISPSDLANRFTPVLKAAIRSQDREAREMALGIHAQLSHYFNSLISEEELLCNLALFGNPEEQGIASLSFHVVRKAEPEPASYNVQPPAVISKEFQLVTS